MRPPAAVTMPSSRMRPHSGSFCERAVCSSAKARSSRSGRARAPEYSWDRVTERIVDFYYETRERVRAASDTR